MAETMAPTAFAFADDARGEIDLNAIRGGKPFLAGWFEAKATFSLPGSFFVLVDGQRLRLGGAKERPGADGDPPGRRRFECVVHVDWPPPIARPRKVEVFLVSAEQEAIPLSFAPRHEGLIFD